jgi:hypothetical protein
MVTSTVAAPPSALASVASAPAGSAADAGAGTGAMATAAAPAAPISAFAHVGSDDARLTMPSPPLRSCDPPARKTATAIAAAHGASLVMRDVYVYGVVDAGADTITAATVDATVACADSTPSAETPLATTALTARSTMTKSAAGSARTFDCADTSAAAVADARDAITDERAEAAVPVAPPPPPPPPKSAASIWIAVDAGARRAASAAERVASEFAATLRSVVAAVLAVFTTADAVDAAAPGAPAATMDWYVVAFASVPASAPAHAMPDAGVPPAAAAVAQPVAVRAAESMRAPMQADWVAAVAPPPHEPHVESASRTTCVAVTATPPSLSLSNASTTTADDDDDDDDDTEFNPPSESPPEMRAEGSGNVAASKAPPETGAAAPSGHATVFVSAVCDEKTALGGGPLFEQQNVTPSVDVAATRRKSNEAKPAGVLGTESEPVAAAATAANAVAVPADIIVVYDASVFAGPKRRFA